MPFTAIRMAVLATTVLGSCVFSTALGKEAQEKKSTNKQTAREQLIGWYQADEGRRLTILPKKKKLVAVFDWANGAPTSVGVAVVKRDGEVAFKQPQASESLGIERVDDQVQVISILDLEFRKLAGLEQTLGKYVNAKGQTLEISKKAGEVYCSIDWGNNAPLTNGWLRAAPNGKTVLTGYKWEHDVTLAFDEGSLESISIIGKNFKRVGEPVANLED